MQGLQHWLVGVLVLGPIAFGTLMTLGMPRAMRHALVVLSALITMAASVLLTMQGSTNLVFPSIVNQIGSYIEPLMAVLVFLVSLKIRNRLVSLFALIPLALTAYSFATGSHGAPQETLFVIDPLSLVMVLIISVIGGLITLFAIGYMNKHEHHAAPTAMSSGRFYFFLVAFLGLMNGLVLTDDLKWLTIFWEGTTLCSFFLIGYEGNAESKASAKRAILINAFGGACLALAAFLTEHHGGHATISAMLTGGSFAILPLALMAVATMTKSAQLPFQSWLLGAMVAPTPVSALLHSSTMVKAGSYLILRLAPGMQSSSIATVVAIAGAFTFVAASAMAISQSNGKRVLAYSTIANLGLIASCAGIHSPLAYAAALTILIYHAISKALLFLCVGTIEQTIGSRHIEDMGGILFKMPLTTNVAMIGMASMMVPPFGMLIGKWMSIEASVDSPIVLILMVAGSALTIFFWAKWLGRITTASYHHSYTIEKVSRWMSSVLITMCVMVLAACLGSLPIYRLVIKPISLKVFGSDSTASIPLLDSVDAFLAWPLLVVLGTILLAIIVGAALFKKSHLRLPYLCGENVSTPESDYMFLSVADKPSRALLNSYYLSPIFGENKVTAVCNPIAALIVITLFGVIFK